MSQQESEDDGCLCQGCGKHYKVDLIIPDDLWNEIRPEGKAPGAGLLCGCCIMDRLEGRGNYGVMYCFPYDIAAGFEMVSTQLSEICGKLAILEHNTKR